MADKIANRSDLMSPVSIKEARAMLADLQAARPALFESALAPGHMRGIDAYGDGGPAGAYRVAANLFYDAHKRLPDLIARPATADGFFEMKFFYPVPMTPNPADKLEAHVYLPEALRDRVGSPKRLWVSETPALPPDAAVPPGRYWLKVSNGNAMHARFDWPPSPALRAKLDERARKWRKVRYGLRWGEWWYGRIEPRFFLEEDLSERMAGEPEIKVFVRDGRVVLFYAIRHGPGGANEQSYFGADGRLLDGRSRQNVPLSCALPESLPTMLKASAGIGRHFRLARIDWLNVAGPTPYLGEITLCHNNARRILAPARFDAWARDQLFGPVA